jgi:uncharacterized membrane protein
MTAIESLIEALLPYIDRTRISDTALQNIVEEHVAMSEREQALRDMMQRDEASGLYDAPPD